jgi:hypothetical protein
MAVVNYTVANGEIIAEIRGAVRSLYTPDPLARLLKPTSSQHSNRRYRQQPNSAPTKLGRSTRGNGETEMTWFTVCQRNTAIAIMTMAGCAVVAPTVEGASSSNHAARSPEQAPSKPEVEVLVPQGAKNVKVVIKNATMTIKPTSATTHTGLTEADNVEIQFSDGVRVNARHMKVTSWYDKKRKGRAFLISPIKR